MKNIKELLQQYCPNGVKCYHLQDLCRFQNGFAFKSGLFRQNGLPIIRISNIQNNSVNMHNLVYFDKNDYSEDLSRYKVGRGELLIAMSGATVGKIAYVEHDYCFYLNQRVGKFIPLKELLDTRFLYHYLLRNGNYFFSMSVGAVQPNLSSSKLMKTTIHLPPLPVQQSIAGILDRFSCLQHTLTASLEAEIAARRKQYCCYRALLLDFSSENLASHPLYRQIQAYCSDSVEYSHLKNIVMLKHGKDYKKLAAGNIPVYGSGGILAYVDRCSYDKTTVLIPRKGSINNLFYLEKPFWNVDTVYYTEINVAKIIPKFFYYFMQSINLSSLNTSLSAGRPSLTVEVLNKIAVPIPPLAIQGRIVAILDNFSALIHNTSLNLSAEIIARRKQYQYYREQLFSFSV